MDTRNEYKSMIDPNIKNSFLVKFEPQSTPTSKV
jgi:hypothetical protein